MQSGTRKKNGAPVDGAIRWIGSVPSLIVHTVFFLAIFGLILLGYDAETVLLVLTTAVSLEAIYLAIFIQMSVNRATASIAEVEEDIDEIQEDVEGIQEDVEDIQEDIDEIERGEQEEDAQDRETRVTLENIQSSLEKLLGDLNRAKRGIAQK